MPASSLHGSPMNNISVSSDMSESRHLVDMTCIAAASDVAFVVSPQLPKANAQQTAATTYSHLQHSCANATKLCTVVRLKRAPCKQVCCQCILHCGPCLNSRMSELLYECCDVIASLLILQVDHKTGRNCPKPELYYICSCQLDQQTV